MVSLLQNLADMDITYKSLQVKLTFLASLLLDLRTEGKAMYAF